MGNLAGTLRSYAQSRYGMPLDILWTRFQRALQEDEKLNSSLQDAKVQLDFLVSLAWVAGVFILFWSVVLAFWSQSLVAFLALLVVGPFLVYLLYRLACQAYLTFSEVMRSAVDLHRLDLLTALRMPPGVSWAGTNEWGRIAEWLGPAMRPMACSFVKNHEDRHSSLRTLACP